MSQQPIQPNDPKRLLEMALEGMNADPRPRREPPTAADLEAALPQFEVLGLIGQGGMGFVFKAREKKLDRVVALKVLPRDLVPEPSFEERFLREARAQASLSHPNILTVFDFGESDEFFYIAAEFVDGVDLRQLLQMERLAPAEALRLVPSICDALQYAHDRGVVHRDIKPENILVDQDGRVYLADFGLAKMLRGADAFTLTRTEQGLGTPHYMAPEQMMSAAQVDHRADIYALGVVIYEMLTGQLPIGRFQMPSEKAGTRKELDEVVMRALAQAVEDRYQSVREVKSDVEDIEHIEAVEAGEDVEAVAAEPPRQAVAAPSVDRGGARMSRKPIAALVILLLGVAGFCTVLWMAWVDSADARRHEMRMRAYEVNQFAIAETERAGREWTGARLARPEPRRAGRLLAVGAPFIVLAVLLVGLCVMILGFRAIGEIKRSRGRLTGMGLAVFVAWLMPLALVNGLAAAPLSAIRDHDTQVLAVSCAVVVLLAGTVWFLRWQYRRHAFVGGGEDFSVEHRG